MSRLVTTLYTRAHVPLFNRLCAYPLPPSPHAGRELKSVQLKTLNTERAEMVTDAWLRTGRVPTAAEVGRGRGGGRGHHDTSKACLVGIAPVRACTFASTPTACYVADLTSGSSCCWFLHPWTDFST
jgi:hypothetical protein